MNRLLLALPLTLLVACSDDDNEAYPALITEFANLETSESGALSAFTNDAGRRFVITNTADGYTPNTVYRVVAGYTDEGDGRARLYTLAAARVLRDSTAIRRQDPTGVVAVWRAGKYINLHLAPMTHGGTQYWGFAVDSVRDSRHYLSVHHNQGRDQYSYTDYVYASLPVDSIKDAEQGDSLFLSVHTSKGCRTWGFAY